MEREPEQAHPTAWTVVLAAGGARRFGEQKQLAELNGRRLVDRAVLMARSSTDGVVLVVPQGTGRVWPAVDAVVTGGATRSQSVRAGLMAVPHAVEIVVIHDAAHPLAGTDLFAAVIGAVRDGAEAAVPGLPVAEALRRVSAGLMGEDVDRSRAVLVQMPQAFRARVLRQAHADAPEAVEDSVLVHRSGGRVRVIEGDPGNIHVTTAADLELVRAIDRGRR